MMMTHLELCRSLLAAAIEGKDEVLLLRLEDRKLSLVATKCIPAVRLPNSLAFDGQGTLWGAGGCDGLLPFTLGALTGGSLNSEEVRARQKKLFAEFGNSKRV